MKLKNYISNKKTFEFYVLNITEDNSYYEDIISIFLSALYDPFIFQDNNHTIIVTTETNEDMNQLVNAIMDDFGYNLKVFKSNKIESVNIDYFNILKKLYYKYENIINESYISIKQIALAILEKNIEELDILKPIITKKITEDPKLLEIVNGMFINDLNVCKTANYVYMHRNTINNKLNLIKEETGLDIQKFQEAVILYALIKR